MAPRGSGDATLLEQDGSSSAPPFGLRSPPHHWGGSWSSWPQGKLLRDVSTSRPNTDRDRLLPSLLEQLGCRNSLPPEVVFLSWGSGGNDKSLIIGKSKSRRERNKIM
jgi:hypothetical protein